MSDVEPLKLPRVLELLIFIAQNEGMSAGELVQAGFSKPMIYPMLTALEDHGVIAIKVGESRSKAGNRFIRTYYLSDLGKRLSGHLLEFQKLAIKNI